MGLETGTYIDSLVATNPVATDPVHQGDDHLRLIKSTVKASFPNITGAAIATHTELNNLIPLASRAGSLTTIASSDLMHVNRLMRPPSQVTLTYISGVLSKLVEIVANGTRTVDLTYSAGLLTVLTTTVDGVVRTESLSYSASTLVSIVANEV